MDRYFRLAADCYLVDGAKDSALYDVSRGHLLLLDENAAWILHQCEENQPLDSTWLKPVGLRFLGELHARGLGTFEHTAVFVDKIQAHAVRPERASDPPRPRRIDWQMTNRCDLGCKFCPRTGGQVVSQACVTCVRSHNASRSATSTVDPIAIVKDIAEMGGGVLHIRGGNPLLEWNGLRDVAVAAEPYSNVKITVTSPGSGCSIDKALLLCRTDNVRLNLVMFAIDARGAMGTCGQDVMRRQLTLADALHRQRRLFSVTFILTHATYEDRGRIRQFCRDRWQIRPTLALSYLVTNSVQSRDHAMLMRRIVPPRSIESFYRRQTALDCLSGICEIGVDGGLYPCAGVDRRCGQLSTGEPLMSITSGALDDFWNFTRRDVEPCKRCALRYACLSCAGVMRFVEGQSYHATVGCPFDPDGDVRAYHMPWQHSGSVFSASLPNDSEVVIRECNSGM
jgi:MoaA/NifB/PqqE/SkfB family radical SAM enzyme